MGQICSCMFWIGPNFKDFWHRPNICVATGRRHRRCRFDPWIGKIPWRWKQPIPVFLPGKFHGQRSLVGYSPWGCKELDMTERLHFTLDMWRATASLHACWVTSVMSEFFATLWTVAHQTSLSMGFSRQEYWSGLLYPPPGDLLDTGVEAASLAFSCIGRQVLYHWCHLGSFLRIMLTFVKGNYGVM